MLNMCDICFHRLLLRIPQHSRVLYAPVDLLGTRHTFADDRFVSFKEMWKSQQDERENMDVVVQSSPSK
jgi:hypothetical protein